MIEASEEEKKLGIEVFFTNIKGTGGKLKTEPEDFIVEEIPLLPALNEDGKYVIAKIRAKNWETNKLVRALARALNISRKKIYFAGTKDKRAVSTRIFAFLIEKDKLSVLNLPDIEILECYTANTPVEIGDLLGNKFEVNIRHVRTSAEETKNIVETIKNEIFYNANGFPNFYGVQRFGAVRPITHLVGKYIIRGEFDKAVFTYIGTPMENEHEDAKVAREMLEKERDFKKALYFYPKELIFERAIIHHLAEYPGDYINAIRKLPKNLQMMFIHSYQAYIFNKVLSERLRRRLPLNEALHGDFILPINKYNLPLHDSWIVADEHNIAKLNTKLKECKAYVSGAVFGSDGIVANGIQGEIECKIIEEEKITSEDFIITEMPELSSKGERRNMLAPLHSLDYKVESNCVSMKFQLQKGSYATALLREFMKAESLMAY